METSKLIAVGIVLLFLGTAVIPSTTQTIEKSFASRGHWLYVGGSGPGNYTHIQDAINASSDGDTIFVYDDSSPYHESISINKEIKVIGENKNSTAIDAQHRECAVQINANNTSLEQFAIRNTSNGYGNAICIGGYHNVVVKNNIIKDSEQGIDNSGSFCEFSYNLILTKAVGIYSFSTSDLSIHHNIIQGVSFVGLRLSISNNCKISYNLFTDCFVGIDFDTSLRDKIYGNAFINNSEGVYLQDSMFNLFYHNSFIGNELHASFTGTMFFVPIYNRWVGNYWDDIGLLHVKRIPGYTFIPLGYGFLINRSNFDWHPAKEPYDITGMR